jgi:hypothetical protein
MKLRSAKYELGSLAAKFGNISDEERCFLGYIAMYF